MKNTIMAMAALLAAASLQSCRDDEPSKGTPLEPGDKIQFGATLPDEKTTRTYYGNETGPENARIWPIFWNNGDVKDEIFIYSPDASPEHNQATYNVTPDKQDSNTAAVVKETNPEVSIVAGDNTEKKYNFYALYPASAVKGTATGTTISGTLSAQQQVSISGTTSQQQVSSAGATEGSPTKTLPDMRHCLMTGVSGEVTLQQEKKVGIRFQPFATALDITLNGPVDATPVQVTSVVISTTSDDGYLAGDFRYDFSQNKMAVVTGTASKSVTVNIGTDGKGVTLSQGQTLNLQAFILPDANVKDLSVKVMDTEYRCWKKTLTMTEAGVVGTSRVLKVQLDKLNAAKATTDYSSWMSQLNPNTYISDISLPGAALSFNTAAGGADSKNITQYTDLNGLYNAGVRVFQTYIRYNPTATSTADGKTGAFHITTYAGTTINDPTTSSPLTLDKVFSDLVNHTQGNEFCVLMLCEHDMDKDISGNSVSLSTVYQRLNEITNCSQFSNNLITELNPDATLADVKGKVLLMYQLDTKDNNNLADLQTGVENMVKTVNSWPPLNNSKLAFYIYDFRLREMAGYSPLPYGQVGSEIIYTGSTNETKPSITSNDKNSLMWYTANNKIESAVWHTPNPFAWPIVYCWKEQGSTKLAIDPGEKLNTGFWFIYGQEANAGDYQLFIKDKAIISDINAINNKYDSNNRNKYFMINCGGAPNSKSLTTITNDFNAAWNSNITKLKDKPYGWVMLNSIGNGAPTITNPSKDIISKVIMHNRPSAAGDFQPGVKGQ